MQMQNEWQPIETAPKVGDFLVHLSDGHITAARLIAGKYLACDGGGGKITEPTHWMPLPTAPANDE